MRPRLDRWSWLLLACSLALGGCGSLPDAKPFADASQTLAASVASAGRAVEDSLGEAAALSQDDDARYKERAERFRAAWAERVAATRAVAAYAESISDLVSAGQSGAETVGKVGDALTGLAGALNIPLAGPAVGVAGDLARFLATRLAQVRASATLEAALAEAQPSVDRLAERIATETDQPVRLVLDSVYKNQRSLIKGRFDLEQDQLKEFETRRLGLAGRALADPAVLPVLLQQDQAIATLRGRLAQRDAQLAETAAAYKARLQLLNALSAATTSWAQAHRDLAVAVRQKRQVSVAELQSTITELKTLAKKVSDL